MAVLQVIGAPLAAALLLMEGVCGLHGWQWLFIIEGAATCLWGIVLAVSLCQCPAHKFQLCFCTSCCKAEPVTGFSTQTASQTGAQAR